MCRIYLYRKAKIWFQYSIHTEVVWRLYHRCYVICIYSNIFANLNIMNISFQILCSYSFFSLWGLIDPFIYVFFYSAVGLIKSQDLLTFLLCTFNYSATRFYETKSIRPLFRNLSSIRLGDKPSARNSAVAIICIIQSMILII